MTDTGRRRMAVRMTGRARGGRGLCWAASGRTLSWRRAGDVKSLIGAYERFSSIGGMLPEQVWDHADLPSEGMYEGRSAGSAQPLVWAHAEYIKLLRSVTDGKIFDTISVVKERYAVEPGKRSFRNTTEIFQVARPIQRPSGRAYAAHRGPEPV